jgi:outer membrane receptor protein involved in Fe transport
MAVRCAVPNSASLRHPTRSSRPRARRFARASLALAWLAKVSPVCAILLAASLVASLAVSPAPARAQTPADAPPIGRVINAQGAPIAGAVIHNPSGHILATTDASGQAAIPCAAPCSVVVEAPGFAPRTLLWQPTTPITLDLASVRQQISVTAYRTPLGDLESPASTRLLTAQNLEQSAAITLDGQLRLVPGVETFRRSSSLVANPSSQGISLRGLGSTSASRTLVTQDDVPLNDAFGGWIHWEELPQLSIRSVEVVRGGASDLYGSSAIGGVVNVLPVHPSQNLVELNSSYGSEDTYDTSLLFEGHHGHWGALATGGILGTDGFIQLAPVSRGLVDTPSNVHAQNGLVVFDHQQGALRLFLRGSGMNEARANGTPVQTNGTRLWRYSTGADWNPQNGGSLVFRAYGSAEHYRQTFSTIASDRNSETLNRFALTPDNEMGAVLHWSQPLLNRAFGPGLLFLAGADTHDVRALDLETTIRAGVPGYINLSDRQRQTGLYAELLFTHAAWTISASGRFDWFSNFDGQRVLPAVTPLDHSTERVFDPRLGISRKLGEHFALSATGFRAYRAPTPNELYRSTQVGSFLTLPNNDLRSERATGWETGVAMEQHWGTLRTSYFWTRVNRPITALTTNPASNPIQLTRENLGQIESRGVSVDLQLQPTNPDWKWMTITTGYQHTDATVTQYAQQPQLVGNWIPQVAHNMATMQLRGYRPAIGTLSLQAKVSGHQFDDDANAYLLHSYFKLDAYASHDFGRRIELFTSGENLFDRAIEVGRTPTLTLGTPRVARIGFNLKLTPTGN